MGRRTGKDSSKSYTLPPSPSPSPSHSFSSSSSSDFEFTISISPRKSSATLCPADELFYKGQLLPLHLSPRISMVRTLLLSSSSSSSATTAARDSTGSTSSTNSSHDSHSSFSSDLALFPDCDSSRPSSVTEDDELKRLHNPSKEYRNTHIKKNHTNKYFSFSRFSSVFRKDSNNNNNNSNSNNDNKARETEHVPASSSVKRMSATAREVIRKYLKKVKPLYEKLSQKQRTGELLVDGGGASATTSSSRSGTVLSLLPTRTERSKTEGGCGKRGTKENVSGVLSHSFSGNLRYPRRRSCVSSCPSSMRSSPSHSGVLSQSVFAGGGRGGIMHYGDSSSMEELQSAIQGAIAHCKNSLMQNNTVVSNEI